MYKYLISLSHFIKNLSNLQSRIDIKLTFVILFDIIYLASFLVFDLTATRT